MCEIFAIFFKICVRFLLYFKKICVRFLPRFFLKSVYIMANKNNYVVVESMGGLGNLLYQFAFGLLLSKRLSSITNKKWKMRFICRGDALQNREKFNEHKLLKCIKKFNIENSNKAIDKYGENKSLKIYRLCCKNKLNKLKEIININNNIQIFGYFQKNEFIIDAKDILMKKIFGNINLLNFKNKFNNTIIKPINNNKKTVLIHIRRTDYVTSDGYHTLLSESYYKNAIDIINEKVTNDKCYIITSDDTEYVKRSGLLNLMNNYVILNEINADNCFIYMTLCDHFIIANSTFSLLSYHFRNCINLNDSLLIAPNKWFDMKKHKYNINDYIPLNNNNVFTINP